MKRIYIPPTPHLPNHNCCTMMKELQQSLAKSKVCHTFKNRATHIALSAIPLFLELFNILKHVVS